MYRVLVLLLIAVTGITAESCIKCNSTFNSRCVTDAHSLLNEDCPNSACYSRIVGKSTVRGCVSELDQDILNSCDNDKCKKCVNPGCNNELFPSHRITCHQCNSSINGSCGTEEVQPSPCIEYEDGDKCFIYKKVDSDVFIRGCLSSHNGLCKDSSNCYTCQGHGCNNLKPSNSMIPNAKGGSGSFHIECGILLAALLSQLFVTKFIQ